MGAGHLFHLFNRINLAEHRLILASHTSIPSLPILLPDLKSRLLSCVIYHIESPQRPRQRTGVNSACQRRGLDMSQDVAHFILTRTVRDTNELFNLLNRLDDASLQHQRKLTIPFVKSAGP